MNRHWTHNRRRPLVAAILPLLLPLAACSGGSDSTPAASGSSTSGSTSPSAVDTALPQGGDPVEIDPADFTPGSDHPYFPLVPRTQWTFREADADGSVYDVVVTVTGETRKIADGVTARVVRDTVSEDGEVTEDTFDWYAQDSAGNVWYFGEDTAEFDHGKISREGSFEAGVDGAQPGLIMPADPAPGMSYRQEYYQGQAEDNGAVLASGQQVEVEQGHYDDALLTADSSTIEPRVLEYKLYAPGVGLVLTLDVSGGAAREELLSTATITDAEARAAGTTPLGKPYH